MIKEALYYQRGNSGEEAEKELIVLESGSFPKRK